VLNQIHHQSSFLLVHEVLIDTILVNGTPPLNGSACVDRIPLFNLIESPTRGTDKEKLSSFFSPLRFFWLDFLALVNRIVIPNNTVAGAPFNSWAICATFPPRSRPSENFYCLLCSFWGLSWVVQI
jgi:hypothetical protein